LLKRLIVCFVLPVAAMLCAPGPAVSSAKGSLNLEPNEIMIGALFSGAQVSVSGAIPAGSQVMVLVTGSRKVVVLSTKGRALGFLWMNLGRVMFHQVPTVYLLNLSKSIKEVAAAHPVEWQQLGVGLDSLKGQTEITPSSGDKDALYGEFLKLKEGEALYGMREVPVHYGKSENGVTGFETDIRLPPRVPPGEYEVKALALKDDGSVVAEATKRLNVKEVGVPALLASLSLNHGGLYGLLAVLVAIGAGLLMDLLFGETKGSH
jgi:uncharacterized protein (TIGR02186 family)